LYTKKVEFTKTIHFYRYLLFVFLNMYDLQDKILKNNQNKLDDVV
jgi:hypothetical protein